MRVHRITRLSREGWGKHNMAGAGGTSCIAADEGWFSLAATFDLLDCKMVD